MTYPDNPLRESQVRSPTVLRYEAAPVLHIVGVLPERLRRDLRRVFARDAANTVRLPEGKWE